MPYVIARVESIVAEKEVNYISPVIATEPEIVANIREDVLVCMRELYKTGRYNETNTLNYPALMKIEK